MTATCQIGSMIQYSGKTSRSTAASREDVEQGGAKRNPIPLTIPNIIAESGRHPPSSPITVARAATLTTSTTAPVAGDGAVEGEGDHRHRGWCAQATRGRTSRADR